MSNRTGEEAFLFYGLADEASPGEFRYIGQTRREHTRQLRHLYAKNGLRSPVDIWKAAVRTLGRSLVVAPIEKATWPSRLFHCEDAPLTILDRESQLINEHQRLRGQLLNWEVLQESRRSEGVLPSRYHSYLGSCRTAVLTRGKTAIDEVCRDQEEYPQSFTILVGLIEDLKSNATKKPSRRRSRQNAIARQG